MTKKGEKQIFWELQTMKQKFKVFIRRYSEITCVRINMLYEKNRTVFKYSDEDWIAFENQFNFILPDFVEKLCLTFPQMTKNEQRCCCLFLLDIKTGRIATILGLAPNTVSKYRKVIYEKYFDLKEERTLEDRLFEMI